MSRFTGNKLYDLLGYKFDDLIIEELRTEWGDDFEQKMVGRAVFQHFYDAGAALCFEPRPDGQLALDSIYLYTEGAEKLYDRYKGVLPYELTLELTNADVVRKFGEPDGRPPRGNIVPMFLDYKSLGLQLDFATKSYEDAANPIVSLCLYPPVDMPGRKTGVPVAPPILASLPQDPSSVPSSVSPPPAHSVPSPTCSVCGSTSAPGGASLKFCASCHVARYCSPACQKSDWPLHRTICSDLKSKSKPKS